MIKEYGLDPELLLSKEKFRYFYESSFGVQNGRLILGLPTPLKWASIVRDQIKRSKDIEPVKRRSLINKLNKTLKMRVISRNSSNSWDDDKDWISNAEVEFECSPFQAIVANENPRNKEYVIVNDEIDDENLLWVSNCQAEVLRSATNMADCVKCLLQKSETIIFIDPHFNQSASRFKNTLSAFLDSALLDRVKVIKRIEYHLNTKFDKGFKEDCERNLPQIIDKSLEVNFKQIKEKPGGEKLHDRYILTEIGGVEFTVGLDEQQLGNTGETTGVRNLEDHIYKSLWDQYLSNEPAFDLEREVLIQGLKA